MSEIMLSKEEQDGSLGIITSPFILKAGAVPLSNLIRILKAFSPDLYVVTGNQEVTGELKKSVNLIIVERELEPDRLVKLAKYFVSNLKIILFMTRLHKKVDLWFFFLGEAPLLFPLVYAKIINKRTVLVCSGSLKTLREYESNNPLEALLKFFLNLAPTAADSIVISSKRLVCNNDIDAFSDKMFFLSEHFIDSNKFKNIRNISDRKEVVGYAGRLSEEKGIMELLQAISYLGERHRDVQFIIAGDGPLRDEVETYINEKLSNHNIQLLGWVPNELLPDLLNKLKLLVIPSFTETGPMVLLEAMACGTPVLMTPVGLAQDVVKDEVNGFIITDNSPERVSEGITKALSWPGLEQISLNARNFIKTEYSYDKAVERFRIFFKNIKY